MMNQNMDIFMTHFLPPNGSPILVVDDDNGMLSCMEAALCSCGFPRPALLSDSRNVIPLIRKHHFQLLLLDIIMPHMNGLEVLRRVKEEFPHVQCIMVTAMDKVDHAVESLQSGAFDYLVKPVKKERLRNVVSAALEICSDENRQKSRQEYEEKKKYQTQLKKSLIESGKLKSENTILLEKLKQDKTLFQKTINSIRAAILIRDAETSRIVECNRAAQDFFQFTRDEIIGNTTDFLYTDISSLAQFRKDISLAIEQKGIFELPGLKMKRKDGSLFPADFSVVPIEDDDRKRIAYVILIRDISVQKRMEDQLRQAQKMEAIGTLAGGIAHDFNNILSPIMGYTEMAMDDLPEDSLIRNNMRQVLIAAERARELVKQLLSFSREKEQERKPVKIQYIIKEVVKLLRNTFPASVCIREFIQDCGAVMAEPVQIHQVIMNLCINAFHAMPDQKGSIEVVLEEIRIRPGDSASFPGISPGDFLRLGVQDNGHGIPPDIIEKIFNPYFTTKGPEKGSGLGLSVVHGIVKNHGGHIRVYSETGQGTVFHIYLPKIDMRNPEPEKKMGGKPVMKGNESILLVDDETALLQMTEIMLERLGYHVTSRASAYDALAAFRYSPEKFDLVITDMSMPHMDGAELCAELIRIRSDIPVLLLSGFSELLTEKRIRDMGIKDFIMKPLSRKELSERVRRVLDEKKRETGKDGNINI